MELMDSKLCTYREFVPLRVVFKLKLIPKYKNQIQKWLFYILMLCNIRKIEIPKFYVKRGKK